ncbi:PCI-domain-containing protein [Panus rudis PR-1116 ss-1]|nr:PCI-domain-containing protein [Panus rudis PR-1116 ss-1]
MSEDIVLPIPNLELAQHAFVLSSPKLKHLHENARKELLKGIEADQMAPYYRIVTSAGILPLDTALVERMEKENKEELEKLEERREEAEKMDGESDIADALRAKANYLTRIGDKEKAVEAQKVALEKTPGLGQRIDIVLTLIRIGLFFGDQDLIQTNMTKAEELIDQGGDWDRRNRLKVYRGVHSLSVRQFKRGAELLLDALSTFTATELILYNDFVTLTTVAGVLTLSRVDLKKKVSSSEGLHVFGGLIYSVQLINAPEVNQVLPEVPVLADLIRNLYDSHYDKFFIALATLEETYLIPSRILSPHTRFYTREMRILAYSQLLESYRSLTLESLARSFGVSIDFVDNELSRFIASGRLHCTIDKVHGVVETNRPSLKNAQYETVVKQGDVLLNSVQRLSKVLH